MPLPTEATAAARFVAENGPHLMAEFWGSQLTAIGNLVKTAGPPQARLGEYIDPDIRPDAGKIQIPALRQMAELRGLGSSRWLGQFADGCTITGDLSQRTAFPSKRLKEPACRGNRFSQRQRRVSGSGPPNRDGEMRPICGRGPWANTQKAGWPPPLLWLTPEGRLTYHPAARRSPWANTQ